MFGKLKSEYFSKVFNGLIGNFAAAQQHAILRTRECAFSWLSVLPLKSYHFDLCAQEFRETNQATNMTIQGMFNTKKRTTTIAN